MATSDIKAEQLEYVLQPWVKQAGLDPLVVTKGEGVYFWDDKGEKYTDMSSLLINNNIGFNNQEVNQAIADQLSKFAFVSPVYAAESRSKLAKAIIDKLPDEFGKVFFANAGTEANESALKIARAYTGKQKVLSRYRSYHGATQGSGGLTGEPRKHFSEPLSPGFVKFFDPYLYHAPLKFSSEEEATDYYLKTLRDQIIYEGPEDIAAIWLETITGSNGVIIPPKGYLKGVRELCDEFNILMVCDEVMVGFYRTGKLFAFQNFDVVPDIITFAKGVTSGYVPLGGVVVQSKIADYYNDNPMPTGLTYSGHPLACAAGVASMKFYDDHKIGEHVQEVGKELKAALEDLKKKHPSVGDIRSIGLFAAVEFTRNPETHEPLVPYGRDPEGIMPKLVAELKKRHFMTYSHESVIFVAPPLIITSEELAAEFPKLDEVMSIADEIVAG
ncbi:aminotransferase class III-fold pyridoxal phosphate-dependent enzyme [Leuconostocaceae bacterium ESL0723]|nr:aminotransferase class III-fold pyridoxal phosphate-dependent enzyme [Leuconostocaceae bacterium ESL0723]